MSVAEIERMVDAFWLKVSVTIAKVARNDWLIGLHLALDLARDCLVLQMIRRDQEKKTTVHRVGGWGNDLVHRMPWPDDIQSGEDVLNLVQESRMLYDELAATLLPNYNQRSSLLIPSIEVAKQHCTTQDDEISSQKNTAIDVPTVNLQTP